DLHEKATAARPTPLSAPPLQPARRCCRSNRTSPDRNHSDPSRTQMSLRETSTHRPRRVSSAAPTSPANRCPPAPPCRPCSRAESRQCILEPVLACSYIHSCYCRNNLRKYPSSFDNT